MNALRACQLFAELPIEEVERIASLVIRRALAKGAYLFHEGAASEGFYVVQAGAINVHRVSPAGKEQVIHVFRPGDSFAEAALAGESGYPADARAIEDSVVLMVPKADFLDLLRDRPKLALRMLASMSQHLRILVGLLDDLTLKDVETRLANWLLKRCPRPYSGRPTTITLTQTKRVLAAEIGTVSETLSRTLARFREAGLVETRGKALTVLQPAALAGLMRRNLGEF